MVVVVVVVLVVAAQPVVGTVGSGTCVLWGKHRMVFSILSKKMRKMMVVGVSIYREINDGGDGDKLGEIE